MKSSRLTPVIPAASAFAFAAGMLILSLQLPESNRPYEIGASFFPIILSVGILFLSALQILVSFIKKEETEELPFGGVAVRLILVVVLGFGYVYVLPQLGFTLATTLFLVILFFVGGVRKWYMLTLFPFVTALGIYLIFDLFLKIILPSGIIERILPL